MLQMAESSNSALVLIGHTFSDFETLALLFAFTVFTNFLTSVSSVLVSALMLGITVVCLHGAFRVPEDLFLDNKETSQATKFLSFLLGPTVAAAVPNVGARV